MRTNAIVRIILFSIAIVVLLTILTVGIAADQLMFRSSDTFQEGMVSSTGSISAAEIRSISIDWAAGSISIRPADVTEITLTESAETETDPMVWLQAGSTLKVAYAKDDRFFHVGSTPSKDLLIEVPRDWSCDELEIETAAAGLTVDSLIIGKVDFDGAAGDFDFQNCNVDTLDVDTASGDIRFCGSLNTMDCDAASADCEINVSNCPSRIEIDMASGDLDLTLPESCGFTAKFEALSGDINTDFEMNGIHNGFTSGDGSCRIDISALSGDVNIRKGTEAWNCDH